VPLTDVILTPTAPYATAVSRRAIAKYWLRATVHPAGISLPPGALWLGANPGHPHYFWTPEDRFVFVRRK